MASFHPVDTGGSLGISPRIVPRDNVELQKLLIDERMRCETHKTNYQTLKEEHKKLQDEHVKLQETLAKVHQSGTVTSEQMQNLIKTLQNEVASKSRELEEVRSQTLHPSKLEVIKAEITKELEEPIKIHMLTMDKEVENYRTEHNKLRYDHTFLKAEYEHCKAEHQRKMEEQSLRFQAQLSALTHERDKLAQDRKSSDKNDGQKLLKLQRLKTQLEQKVKNLTEELTELRKQKDHSAHEADLVQRNLTKENAQLQINFKNLEVKTSFF